MASVSSAAWLRVSSCSLLRSLLTQGWNSLRVRSWNPPAISSSAKALCWDW